MSSKMRNITALAVFLLTGFSVAQDARAYYKELRESGKLPTQAPADYACFRDVEADQTFFVFTSSEGMKAEFKRRNTKLSKRKQQILDKPFLAVKVYSKKGASEYLFLDKDRDSWVSEAVSFDESKLRIRTRLVFNLDTFRYSNSVELVDPHGNLNQVITTEVGVCEPVVHP